MSIFVFDCVKNKDRVLLARNAFKRLRTMRHPDMLRYLDGIEVVKKKKKNAFFLYDTH